MQKVLKSAAFLFSNVSVILLAIGVASSLGQWYTVTALFFFFMLWSGIGLWKFYANRIFGTNWRTIFWLTLLPVILPLLLIFTFYFLVSGVTR